MTKQADPPRRGPRRGPRTDGSAGREHVLAAAIAQFGEHGYQDATIRGIAEAAGVNARLVHYYFGSKEELFGTAISHTFRARGLPVVFVDSASPNKAGFSAYLRALFETLEDPSFGPAFIGLVRGLGTHEESRRIFLRFLTKEMLDNLAGELDIDHAANRLALAGSQILGLVMGRYVLKVPLLADLSIDQIANLVGPTIDRYLSGDLEWADEQAVMTSRKTS